MEETILINTEKKGRGRPIKYVNQSEQEKKDLNKTYYQTFKAKNQDKIIDKNRKCELCGGSIGHYYNKSHHNKTKKHIKKLQESKVL